MTSSHSSRASSPDLPPRASDGRVQPPRSSDGRVRATLRRASRRVASRIVSGIAKNFRRSSATPVPTTTPVSTTAPASTAASASDRKPSAQDTTAEDENNLVPVFDAGDPELQGGYKLYDLHYHWTDNCAYGSPTLEDSIRWRAFEDKFLAWCHQSREKGGADDQRPDNEIMISRQLLVVHDDGRVGLSFEPDCYTTTIAANAEELIWLRVNGKDVQLEEIDVRQKPIFMFHATTTSPISSGVLGETAWGLSRISNRQKETTTDYMYDDSGGQGITVYIIDSGIREDVTDQAGQLEFRDASGNSRVRKGFNALPNEPFRDLDGHGTHVAGIVGSRTYGVAKNVSLVDVKVLNMNGEGLKRHFEAALLWVRADIMSRNAFKTSIIHSSTGTPASLVHPSSLLFRTIATLVDNGVPWVTSAGNTLEDAAGYFPASVPGVICVGASDKNDKLAIFNLPDRNRIEKILAKFWPPTPQPNTLAGSNYGERVDIWAPGHNILSTATNDDGQMTKSGTSMAAPFVSGQLAIDMGISGRSQGKDHLLTSRFNTLCSVDTEIGFPLAGAGNTRPPIGMRSGRLL